MCLHEVRTEGLLGMAACRSKYIPNFVKITAPPRNSTKKPGKFERTETQQNAYNQSTAPSSAPWMTHFSKQKATLKNAPLTDRKGTASFRVEC